MTVHNPAPDGEQAARSRPGPASPEAARLAALALTAEGITAAYVRETEAGMPWLADALDTLSAEGIGQAGALAEAEAFLAARAGTR